MGLGNWRSVGAQMTPNPVLLQVVSVANVAQPQARLAGEAAGGGMALHFVRLTDGHSRLSALEYERIPGLS